EFLVRLLLAGHPVVYEPAAWVRHHHATDGATVRAQTEANAAGLASVVTKVVLSKAGRAGLLQRIPAALRELPRSALVSGPVRYLWSRGRARRAGGRVPRLTVGVSVPARRVPEVPLARGAVSRTDNGVATTPP
ncbi:hypothetical protein, partial [Pseudonocardia pini]|uniref:hypothetical protein n=1 Tax=Pseudonocardia pini TaxID=2758030 RepID=UPI001C6924F5